MDKFKGKVAMITGASAGMAKGIAIKLAEEGMHVAAVARRMHILKELEKKVSGKGMIRGYVCDVTDESQVESVMQTIEKEMGKIIVLVNSAGVYHHVTTGGLDIDKWREMMNVHFYASFICIKYLVKSVKQHERETVHIININSIELPTFLGIDWIPYNMTKVPPRLLTKGLVKRFAEEKLNIKITGFDPGHVRTEAVDYLLAHRPEFKDEMLATASMKPEIVAESVISIITVNDDAIVTSLTVQAVGEVF